MPIVKPPIPTFPQIISTIPIWGSDESLANVLENRFASIQVEATDPMGGNIIFSLLDGSLPPGLSLDSDTGIISGTVGTVPEDTPYHFTLQATSDLTGVYNRGSFFITVVNNLPPVWITPSGIIGAFDKNSDVFVAIKAVDPEGDMVITYTIIDGSLPDGLLLDSNTGIIAGVVSNIEETSSFTFTARATDSEGNFSDREFTLFIVIPLDWKNWDSLSDGNRYDYEGYSSVDAASVSSLSGVSLFNNISSRLRGQMIRLNNTQVVFGDQFIPTVSFDDSNNRHVKVIPLTTSKALLTHARGGTLSRVIISYVETDGYNLNVLDDLEIDAGTTFYRIFKFNNERILLTHGVGSLNHYTYFINVFDQDLEQSPSYLSTEFDNRIISFGALNDTYGIALLRDGNVRSIKMIEPLNASSFGLKKNTGAGTSNLSAVLCRLSNDPGNNKMIMFWRSGTTASIVAQILECDLSGDITLLGPEITVTSDHSTTSNFSSLNESLGVINLDDNLVMLAYPNTNNNIVTKVLEINNDNTLTEHQSHVVIETGNNTAPGITLSRPDFNRVMLHSRTTSTGHIKILNLSYVDMAEMWMNYDGTLQVLHAYEFPLTAKINVDDSVPHSPWMDWDLVDQALYPQTLPTTAKIITDFPHSPWMGWDDNSVIHLYEFPETAIDVTE